MDRKKLIGLIILVLLVLAVPLTLYLVRQTQIFKPRAGNVNESRVEVWQGNPSVEKEPVGTASATITDPNVQLKIYYVPSSSSSASP